MDKDIINVYDNHNLRYDKYDSDKNIYTIFFSMCSFMKIYYSGYSVPFACTFTTLILYSFNRSTYLGMSKIGTTITLLYLTLK